MKGTIMNNVFTNPADLAAALLETVNPGVIRVPSIKEQLTELIQPCRAVGFRTESGSFYEVSLYSDMTAELIKGDEETDGIKVVAKGEFLGAQDRDRGVVGVVIKEPDGRTYSTSAVVKVWLAYDAVAGKSYHEPV